MNLVLSKALIWSDSETKPETPLGWIYSRVRGRWVPASSNPDSSVGRVPLQRTKKFDRETGEDRKGK